MTLQTSVRGLSPIKVGRIFDALWRFFRTWARLASHLSVPTTESVVVIGGGTGLEQSSVCVIKLFSWLADVLMDYPDVLNGGLECDETLLA